MKTEQLTVIAQFVAKPGMETALAQALGALVAPSRSEEGCINYDLHQDNTDSAHFLLYENWVNAAALETHFTMPYLLQFLEQSEGLLAEPFTMMRLHIVSAADSILVKPVQLK
ncbi:MAG: antibiotic biosynthesis monooxygenase [Armatimonadetes bacterium]|nr:antibiotic biosynthesis monooxygenase [Anaerolineae bacterium]